MGHGDLSSRSDGFAAIAGFGLSFALEAALYSTLAPLLPVLGRDFLLTDLSAGVIAAGYPAGVLAGSAIGLGVRRVGPQTASGAGFGLIALGSLLFGSAGSIALLAASRVLLGIGAGLVWMGVLGHLLRTTAPGRRGTVIGSAVGMAVAGSIAGPLIGSAAATLGRLPVFSGVALLAGALGLGVAAVQRRARPTGESGSDEMTSTARRVTGSLGARVSLGVLVGIFFGALFLLAPFHLTGTGASAAVVGNVFTGAAILAAVASPAVGALGDRFTAWRLIVPGLCGLALLSLAFIGARNTVSAAALFILLLGIVLNVALIPALSEVNAQAARDGLSSMVAAGLVNVTLATGELVGTGLAATIADRASPTAVFAALAALVAVALTTICGLWFRRVRARGREDRPASSTGEGASRSRGRSHAHPETTGRPCPP